MSPMSENGPERDALPTEAEVAARYCPVISRARPFIVPLTVTAVATGLFAVVLGLLAPLPLSPATCAVVVALLLSTVAVGAMAAVVALRAAILTAALETLEAVKERAQRQAEGRSLFSGSSTGEEEPEQDAGKVLTRYGRTPLPLAVAVGAVAVGGVAGYALAGTTVDGASPRFFVLGLVSLAVAFLAMFASRWLASQDPEDLPEAAPAATVLRALQWYSALSGPALLAHAVGFPVIDLWLGRVLLAVALVMALELLVRATMALLRSPVEAAAVRAPIGLTIAESLFSGSNPITSTVGLLESRFGVSVRSSYVIRYTARVLPLIALGMLAAFWLATSLVCIRPDEAGVLTRFGSLVSNGWYGPGLHLKAPWPIDRIQRVPTERIRRFVIGRVSSEEPPYILWSRTHAEDEYKLVLGEGKELVSLDAQVFYRIKDPVAFVYRCQNPETALNSLAYRLVVREIVSCDLEYVLSEARATLSDNLRSRLQDAVDAEGLGVEVVEVALRGIHPPVEVAEAYQSVVSAQVEQVTLAIAARANRAKAIPAAEAQKHASVADAKAKASTRLAAARGEAIRFNAEEAAYSADPGLYRQRLWLETMENAIADKRVYLVDPHTAGEQEYWVDLRAPAPSGKK